MLFSMTRYCRFSEKNTSKELHNDYIKVRNFHLENATIIEIFAVKPGCEIYYQFLSYLWKNTRNLGIPKGSVKYIEKI